MSFMDTHEDWIHEIKLTRLREQLKVGTDQVKINDTDPIDLGQEEKRTPVPVLHQHPGY